MIKAAQLKADIINDVSGFNYDNQSIKILKRFNISKKFITCKVLRLQCKKDQNIKMFY